MSTIHKVFSKINEMDRNGISYELGKIRRQERLDNMRMYNSNDMGSLKSRKRVARDIVNYITNKWVTACELSEVFGIHRYTVKSYALKFKDKYYLMEGEKLERKKENKFIWYRIVKEEEDNGYY